MNDRTEKPAEETTERTRTTVALADAKVSGGRALSDAEAILRATSDARLAARSGTLTITLGPPHPNGEPNCIVTGWSVYR